MANKGRMIYLPEDLNIIIKRIHKDIGIKSPAEALRMLINNKNRNDEGELNFKI